MEQFLQTLWEASIQGSIIILAVLLLRLFLKRSPRLVCLLWLLAVLRLALPVQIESELSLQPQVEPLFTQQTEPSFEDTFQQAPDNIVISDAIPEDLPGDVTVYYYDILAPEVEVHVVDYGAIAAGVWLAGVCGMGLYCLISYLRLKRRVREAVLTQQSVYESAELDSAFVLGYFRPRVYLPAGLEGSVRELIVAHERAHIARLDHWYKLFAFAVLALHWFNPLVWLCYWLLCRDIESACDAHVVRGMDVDQRKAYCSALLSCNARGSSLRSCPVAFAEDNVKKRIVDVLHYKKPGFWLTVAGIIAVIFVAVCFLTSPGTSKDELLDQCREALADFQALDCYWLAVHKTCSPDLMLAWDQAEYIHSGENWYHETSSPDWKDQYLQYGSTSFTKDTSGAIPPADIPYSEWTQVTFTEEDYGTTHHWLMTFEWDTARIRYQNNVTTDDSQTVSVTVSPGDGDPYVLDFHFNVYGTLTAITKTVTVNETGEYLIESISIVSTDADQIGAVIDVHHLEAHLASITDEAKGAMAE